MDMVSESPSASLMVELTLMFSSVVTSPALMDADSRFGTELRI